MLSGVFYEGQSEAKDVQFDNESELEKRDLGLNPDVAFRAIVYEKSRRGEIIERYSHFERKLALLNKFVPPAASAPAPASKSSTSKPKLQSNPSSSAPSSPTAEPVIETLPVYNGSSVVFGGATCSILGSLEGINRESIFGLSLVAKVSPVYFANDVITGSTIPVAKEWEMLVEDARKVGASIISKQTKSTRKDSPTISYLFCNPVNLTTERALNNYTINGYADRNVKPKL